MSKPAIQVKGISKSYKISHEMKANVGDVTMRDTIVRTLKKPVELLTGHVMKKEKFWALHDVSFDVQPGEVVGIIGKNGSGKSTLLKIMSRITEPTHGEIVMNGRVASLLEVGTGFHPELTGRENIYFNGSILGMKKKEIEAKFDEIVAFSEVEKFLDTPVKFYSSGMYVRLAFAVAAHLEPDILIVDEVLAVGDAAFQKKCLGKMQDVAGQGRTVLFVSHNMNSINQLCNKAIYIREGKLIEESKDVRAVIDMYFDNQGILGKTLEWKNNKNITSKYFDPQRVYISKNNSSDVVKEVKPLDDSVDLVIEGKVKKLDPLFNVGCAIYSEDGTLLFWSTTTDLDEDKWPKIHLGRNKFSLRLPKHLLNVGDYRIEAFASLHNKEWLFEPGQSAPSITLKVRGELSNSPYWQSPRPGLLAPQLQWDVS